MPCLRAQTILLRICRERSRYREIVRMSCKRRANENYVKLERSWLLKEEVQLRECNSLSERRQS